MVSVNTAAAAIVDDLIARADALGVRATVLENGARVVDCGIAGRGSLAAGCAFAEASMGGLGRIELTQLAIGDDWLPGLHVAVDQPAIGCLASQFAGWAIKHERFFAMGSGPARALARPDPLFERLTYRDAADVAVLTLEGRTLPTAAVAALVAAKCGVAPANLRILIAPTASIVGSVQIAARVVETAMHKLAELGFPIEAVVAGAGTCPIAPVAADDLHAIGRTNDAVLYGGRVFLWADLPDEPIAAVVDRVPSCASRDYGTPFYDLYRRYGDFYAIDPMLFSPAVVAINSLQTGRTFRAGHVNADLLRASFLP